jgi:hypothetical protein
METSLICSILDAHFEGMRQRQTAARAYNGLANYPFYSLMFGSISYVRIKCTSVVQKKTCSAAFVQPEFERFITPLYAHHARYRWSALRTCDLPSRRPEVARPINRRELTSYHAV